MILSFVDKECKELPKKKMTKVPYTLELIFDKPYMLINKNKQVISRTNLKFISQFSKNDVFKKVIFVVQLTMTFY